jgi:MFS family permease
MAWTGRNLGIQTPCRPTSCSAAWCFPRRGCSQVIITAASTLAIFITFLAESLTDRVGRRPLYIGACLVAILFAFPMYLLTNDGTPALVIAVFVFEIGFIHATLTGNQESLLTEQFGTSTRTSGASLGYQIAAAIGGFAPLLAAVHAGWIGWTGASLLYMTAADVALIGILVTKETYGRAERERINALAAEEKAAAGVS